MSLKTSFSLFLLFYASLIWAQEQVSNTNTKIYQAERIETSPVIDGILNDSIWKNAALATNFVMLEPGDGNPSRETHQTEVKILYDDEAIYIAAYMYDNEPDKILRQFTQRDNIGQSDFFLIDFNTYNDGENQTRFLITSAGAHADAKMAGENEDYSYNVVWEGEISYDDNGWYAELKIPYAALRFPKMEEQLWSIQMARQISHLNEVYTWSYVNKAIGKFSQYNGLLKGIKNIDPPVRLSFYPYTSAEVDNFNGTTQANINAGLDFKYGISDGFTLDATLIPDFGQTAFDAVELNLGPFEQVFSENRAFFTEGTELFTKGNLFFSRRIGDSPIGFNNAQRSLLANEVIIDNPEEVALINALKVSGRTKRNLGVGFFNAVTNKTFAIVQDTITNKGKEIVTEPFANYNIFVLDQQFNQNSSITLINTNVTREGNFRDGNVTGLLFDIFNKSNSFNFTGEAKMSNVNLINQNLTGFASTFGVERTKGQIRYRVTHDFANETYDINDLGVNFVNNYNDFYVNTSYQIFEPTENFNRLNISLYGNHRRRYIPNIEMGTGVGGSFFASTRERFAFGGSIEGNSKFRDFFEPRADNSFVVYPKRIGGNAFASSDYRKKFAYDVRVGYTGFIDSPQESYSLRLSPRFRFNDKFSVIYNFRYSNSLNRDSFVRLQSSQVVFGGRDLKSLENGIQSTYNFDTKHGINLSFRNFWSAATFEEGEFTKLNEDGSLEPITYNTAANNPNVNFNIWNFDLSYRWQFAPGSEAILLYRNSIFNLDNLSELNYIQSLDNLFQAPIRQNLSLRIVYFIDYNNVKNIFKNS